MLIDRRAPTSSNEKAANLLGKSMFTMPPAEGPIDREIEAFAGDGGGVVGRIAFADDRLSWRQCHRFVSPFAPCCA
ncbi:hypothetical protein PLANPX_3304 [Lacipirellula parvula]|uniref:Uncharacterized protein n=1 Tax=Lacipirellula parvula TaxID=2650471 RepID=A0A5K7XCJ6_9BACT|nr:hypothetical protein PLANPX_3304 [Lacipirellula parvula]